MQLFSKQRAFTLIELLVVILIIGILIAVAAPSFLGQADKAHNSATKQSLTVVRKEAKAVYVNNDGVHPVLGTVTTPGTILNDFKTSEPQYGFSAGPGGATTINTSVTRDSDSRITACQQSKSGVMFCLTADEEAGLEQIASSGNNLLGVESAYAATTDVVYSTGTGTNAAAAETAARCVLEAAADGETPNCPGGTAGWSEFNQDAAPDAETPAPVNTVLPTIVGQAVEGETLTANGGVWTNATEFNYQWQRSVGAAFEDIDGANSTTYQITDNDIDTNVRVVVTEGNYDPQVSATSLATAPVIGKPLPTTQPSFTGNGIVGVTLVGNKGVWVRADEDGFTYQWNRDGNPISGATSLNYTLVSADAGHAVQLGVTNTNNGLASEEWYSASTNEVENAPVPVNTSAPTMTGHPAIGFQAQVNNNGTWTDADEESFTYQWQRNTGGTWDDISGATNHYYNPVAADRNHSIRVAVTANGSVTAYTAASDAVLGEPENTVAPYISGTVAVNSEIAANNGTWTQADYFSYQWYRDGNTISSNGSSATYNVTSADVGHKLSVRVTAYNYALTHAEYSNETITVPVPPDYGDKVAAMSPYLLYRMDDTNSSSLLDSSGNSRNASLSAGGSTTPTVGNDGMDSGKSVKFSATGTKWYERAALAYGSGQDFTLSVWLKDPASPAGGWRYPVSNNSFNGFSIYRVESNTNAWGIYMGSYPSGTVPTNTAGQWKNVILRRTGGVNTLYINGTQVASNGHVPVSGGQFMVGVLGSAYGGNSYDGYVDNLAYFDRAVNSTEFNKLVSPATT